MSDTESAEKNGESSIKTYQIQNFHGIGEKLYLDSKTADAFFIFTAADGKKCRVPAHKCILSVLSNVFDRSFYGKMKKTGDIVITEVSEAAFMEFLQFFYLSEVKLTKDNIAGVMLLGHKYNVTKCLEICAKYLKEVLTIDNICSGLRLAIQYNQPNFLKYCDTFISLNTMAIFKTTGFLESDRSILEHFLRMDLLSCSEVDVFEACMDWARAKSKQSAISREHIDIHLGNYFYEIRFASMTMHEVCTLASKYKSVLLSEISTIINIITLPGFQSENFNQQKRHPKWNPNAIVRCDRGTADEKEYPAVLTQSTEATFSMTETTTEPLLLGNFTCVKIAVDNGSNVRNLKWDLNVDVEIIETTDLNETENMRSLCKMEAKLKSADTKVILPHPVLIRPGFYYKICVSKFPDGFVGCCRCVEVISQLDSDISIEFTNCYKMPKGGKIIGLVSALEFNRI